jgi:aspartate kinase
MKIGGIVENHDLTLYRITSLIDEPGAAGAVLKIFAQNNINIEYISESSAANGSAVMAICIKSNVSDKLDKLLQADKVLLGHLKIKKIEYVMALGIYGPHFREKPFLAAKFCMILGDANVNILGISSSISSISVIIKSSEVELAKKALLKEYELP